MKRSAKGGISATGTSSSFGGQGTAGGLGLMASSSAVGSGSASSASLRDSIKQSVCITSLKQGHVESFGDLFTLAYRAPVLVDETAERYFSVSETDLSWISERLCSAETARRNGLYGESDSLLREVASFFEVARDHSTALYFLELNLRHCSASGDLALEGSSLTHLGNAYERLDQNERAVAFHERSLVLARAAHNKEAEANARRQLVKVYTAHSDEALARASSATGGDFHENAAQFMMKAMEHTEDPVERGVCEHKLAAIYASCNRLDKAAELEHRYLDMCLSRGDTEGAIVAAKALCEMDDSVEVARQYLKLANASSANNTDPAAYASGVESVSGAMVVLGLRLNRDGDFEGARELFEQNFRLAQTAAARTNDKARVEVARILVGLARGNAGLGQFMAIVNKDMPKLLSLKIQAVRVSAAAAATS